jgi:DNA mismatch repair protein MutH
VHEAELRVRAEALAGRTLGEVARALDAAAAERAGRHTKGRAGDLIERALGASAGSTAAPDFPSLGVELKTIPIDARGAVRESTFVCTLALDRIAAEAWQDSWVRRKLSRVLWVPIEAGTAAPLAERRIGRAVLWSPSSDESAALAGDYEAIAALVGVGAIDELDARLGECLQVRPKGRDGVPRATALGPDGELLAVVPRGFYLRATFTTRLLARAYAA